ncbi:MAG TPA: hypothetical protein VLM40_10490 [Gemmata sp.]|nr:hypothetical protein [Gemmata sp.]
MSTDPSATPETGAGHPGDPGTPDWSGFTRFAGIAAIAGFILFAAAGFLNISAAGEEHTTAAKARFASGFLTGYTFWLSLPVGAMALLLIAHLVKSSWGLLLRRPFEAASRTLPLLFGLWVVLIVVASQTSLYWWTHPEEIHISKASESALTDGTSDKREQAIRVSEVMVRNAVTYERNARASGNYGFLSLPAFIGVGVVLFLIWGTMTYFLNKWGQEAANATTREGVEAALTKANKLGGPGLIIYAITITAGATQWVMSVEPSWSSTMFPVIFAVNQLLTAFAFCLALFLLIVGRPPFKDVMRPKFQLDMGTLLLAFTMFWSYTSFSQFMLVWIGNLPEEIPFFLRRSTGGWWWVSAALCVFHFAVPFLLLLFRDIKLHPVRLRAVAVYLLFICALDVMWWIAPTFNAGTSLFPDWHSSFPAWLIDVGAVAGIGGLWGLYFIRELKSRPLMPVSEVYRLPEGHHHEQH